MPVVLPPDMVGDPRLFRIAFGKAMTGDRVRRKLAAQKHRLRKTELERDSRYHLLRCDVDQWRAFWAQHYRFSAWSFMRGRLGSRQRPTRCDE